MKKKLSEKPRCCARLVLGGHLASSWASCSKRVEGLCCKDCKEVKKCKTPCALLQKYYRGEDEGFNFERFSCRFYLTELEGLIKRLGDNKERGVKE